MAPGNLAQGFSEIQLIKVFIEVEGGSRLRNLYDENTLEFKGARQSPLPYPYPYGFILGTSAADEACVDCYVITHVPLKHGSIVECMPVGLLEVEEDGDDDRKALAALPGQDVALDHALLETLRDFIYGIFAQYPEITIQVGRILSAREARRYIQRHRVE